MPSNDSRHHITLFTVQQRPLLEGDLRTVTERGIKNLPTRYPGLKIVDYAIHPNRVELVLDFHRLDEDVLRVLQSLKNEVKKLAARKGFTEASLWQWNYEDQGAPS